MIETFDFKRIIMIYYDFDLQYKQQKEIFMNCKNLNTKEHMHQT